MIKPKFSIITPTYNRNILLKRAITSVLNQSFENFEHIIVNDASTNDLSEIIKSYHDDRIIYIQHEMNMGVSAAYNTGMKAAKGSFICFLDDDDEYFPLFLERINSFFESAEKKIGFVWTGIQYVKNTAQGEIVVHEKINPAWTTKEQAYIAATTIGNGHGLCIRSSCIEKIGLYDETFKVCVDTEFMFRLAKKFDFSVLSQVLVKIHQHDEGQLTDIKYYHDRAAMFKRILKRNKAFIEQYQGLYEIHTKHLTNLYEIISKESKKLKQKAYMLDPGEYELWDDFVDDSDQGDVFCYSWWLKSATDNDFNILAVKENGKIVAGLILPFYSTRNVNEPNLTRNIGVLYRNIKGLTNQKILSKKRNYLTALLEEISIDKFIQFCMHYTVKDWLPFRWKGFDQRTRYTYILNYEKTSLNEIWDNIHKKHKRQIKNALLNNIQIKESDEIDIVHHFSCLSFERQNLKFPYSLNYLRQLDKELRLRKKRKIFKAIDEKGRIHAVFYVLFNNSYAFALLSGGNPELRKIGGHTMVVWHAIKFFHDKVKIFNFGGSDIKNIERHLRRFGGKQQRYFHIFNPKRLKIDSKPNVEISTYSDEHISQLIHWINDLDTDIQAVFNSKSWHIGRFFVKLILRFMGKKTDYTAKDNIKNILDNISTWREQHAEIHKE
ncbi:Glycosyl transferase, family 2 domain protein [Candidatus Magnetomorum sp. HK-1]|nr:Glycosyl transferase, family 2 domain protein [Candidatus Magnetomorum sp. HK-1]